VNIQKLPRGDKYPEEFNMIVEITKGSRNKYEYDEELDIIKLDRVGYTTQVYILDYGFIPQTRSEDGDHLDAFIFMDSPTFPYCLIKARPIGVMYMIDSGDKDEKIIAVPVDDVRYNHITELDQMSPHFKKELQHHFEHYKDLQNKKVEVTGWGNREDALKVMNESIEDSG
jgi:inorganic pyrophosphatase